MIKKIGKIVFATPLVTAIFLAVTVVVGMGIKKMIKFVFSTRLMAVLFVVFAVAMALGTFIENDYDIETARIWIYNAWWFELIMLLFMVNFIANIKRYNLLKRENWSVFLLHISWVFIIIGAFITRYISDEGIISLREGETADFYVSDRTYITAFVDGNYQGEGFRKTDQREVLFSKRAKNNYQWKSDFKGIPFDISYKDFIRGASEGFVEDPEGEYYLKIVETVGGNRHEHYLKYGEVANFHNILFALNRPTIGAINITMTEEGNYINTPFSGTYMNMATQERFDVVKDSLQPLQFLSLYNLGQSAFVIPQPLVRGREGVQQLPQEQITKESPNAVVFEVKSGEEIKEVAVLGGKGYINPPTTVTVNGLDFHLHYGSRRENLPFSVTLNDFIADKYPGTEKSYSSFMSKVTVKSDDVFDYDIYMNHILNHKGHRLFQAQFHPDEKGSVLSVNQDYWGTLFTYIGYVLLYIGLIAFMFLGKSRFIKLGQQLKQIQAKRMKISVLLLLFSTPIWAQNSDSHPFLFDKTKIDSLLQATTVDATHAEKFGELVIQDAGRMKPIHTFSSELLRKMSKKDTFKNMDANQVFLSMMLNPVVWYHVDFIFIKKANDSLHKILGVEKGKKYVSAIDFVDKQMRSKLDPYLQEAYATNTPNQFQKDFKEADQRLRLLDRALSGDILKIFPLLESDNNKWVSPVEFRYNPEGVKDTLYANFIHGSVSLYLNMLRDAIKTGNYENADALLEAFKKNQKNHGEAVLPAQKKIQAEIVYNKVHIFNRLFQYYLFAGLVLFFVSVIQIFSSRNKVLNFIGKASWIFLCVSFLLHTLGLVARWYISGHAPWSDAYESMIYVAWATMLMGVIFARRSQLTLGATAFVTSMILMIAHWNWMDPSIGTLQPVLNSYWLMIHVAVIVGSYGPFALGMILGVVSMFLMIFTNAKNKQKMSLAIQELMIVGELALTLGLVMLTIGNFLGGMWANESWGRYWGWDPKETWALVSIMVYAFVIHMRLVPGLRGRWAFSFASVVSFFSILMTYFGVNFYLSGLHSYASGEKIITPSFVYYSVAFVLILGAVSFWRYRVNYKK
ncbi:cytochrome c biogenesis protein [Capnocytophaga canimorsus]|uniref:cytochrome c biogenesis protein n=1 Tax=Capnocytophaga canimorsus TaxID=28188 RepID=UPI001AD4C96B|nr:cytochrome c biogenesis protein CcsA [Capnocytophaga canimorsus]GIM58820.1 cytochrome c biogenesis protein [Capnocytophaga canimorsus]